MPTPSKFTATRRKRILDALRIGLSRRTAAALARIDEKTLRRWLAKGEKSQGSGTFRQFYEQAVEAEAHVPERAMAVVYREMDENPALARQTP
jgi:hypothetical protein